MGPEYDSVFLCNSGAQAVDFAHLVSRLYTKQNKIVTFRNSYHGGHGQGASLTNIGIANTPNVRNIEI